MFFISSVVKDDNFKLNRGLLLEYQYIANLQSHIQKYRRIIYIMNGLPCFEA